jgi:hypothetical protein
VSPKIPIFAFGWLVFGLSQVLPAAPVPTAGAPQLKDRPPDAETVAWVRFSDAPERYDGVPYHWLGHGDLRLVFEAPPAPGQALELLWGAKDDVRSATLGVNGVLQPLEAGGYRGFRWLRVPLTRPAGGGDPLEITLTAAGVRPAFVAEARLTAPGGAPDRPGLDQKAFRAVVLARGMASAAQVPGVLADQRAFWDGEPSATLFGGLDAAARARFRQAERNSRLAAEAFFRCRHYVTGWLGVADPRTGLIPENLSRGRDRWNGRNNAADNYAFMVLTCALTDRPLLEGRMRQMLETESRLTRRLDRLGDWYQFSRAGFEHDTLDWDRLVFDNAEYVKDGLIPLTEWLGPSPWSERMIGLVDDIWKHAPVPTPAGPLPTLNFEVNGDLLQACSRLYWFTGQRKYLEWAIRLGDYYLLGTNHPTRHLKELRLMDHGGEVVNGLTELYVAVSRAAPEKQKAYRAPLREILDSILEKGRNADGMLYSWYRPGTGENSGKLADTWGYIYDGFYTLYLVDGTEAYRAAVAKALENLAGKYEGRPWADQSMDGIADAVEGALNLLNRLPVASAAEWCDRQMRLLWNVQRADGIIEGWHGDGNFARTTIMYALWKTQGVTVQPWRKDLRVGAVRNGPALELFLAAGEPWEGKVIFDPPRHQTTMHLPLDYPRINQFPEWFTVADGRLYEVADRRRGDAAPTRHRGADLIKGVAVTLQPGKPLFWSVSAVP